LSHYLKSLMVSASRQRWRWVSLIDRARRPAGATDTRTRVATQPRSRGSPVRQTAIPSSPGNCRAIRPIAGLASNAVGGMVVRPLERRPDMIRAWRELGTGSDHRLTGRTQICQQCRLTITGPLLSSFSRDRCPEVVPCDLSSGGSDANLSWSATASPNFFPCSCAAFLAGQQARLSPSCASASVPLGCSRPDRRLM